MLLQVLELKAAVLSYGCFYLWWNGRDVSIKQNIKIEKSHKQHSYFFVIIVVQNLLLTQIFYL